MNYIFESFPAANVDGIIYLRADPTLCIERVKKRQRNEEEKIPEDYIISLHTFHEIWLNSNIESDLMKNISILTIDCTPDFRSDKLAALNATESVKAFVKQLSEKE